MYSRTFGRVRPITDIAGHPSVEVSNTMPIIVHAVHQEGTAMHPSLPRSWRHRLLVLHIAAGAGVFGAGVLLMAASGLDVVAASAPVAILLAHLAALAAVLGLLAVIRIRRRRSRRLARDGVDPASPHVTPIDG
jgi:heme A synthase